MIKALNISFGFLLLMQSLTAQSLWSELEVISQKMVDIDNTTVEIDMKAFNNGVEVDHEIMTFTRNANKYFMSVFKSDFYYDNGVALMVHHDRKRISYRKHEKGDEFTSMSLESLLKKFEIPNTSYIAESCLPTSTVYLIRETKGGNILAKLTVNNHSLLVQRIEISVTDNVKNTSGSDDNDYDSIVFDYHYINAINHKRISDIIDLESKKLLLYKDYELEDLKVY